MSAANDTEIAALLRFDPLGEAERITGTGYKENPNTMMLGMALAASSAERKRAALEATGDTHFTSSFAETRAVLAGLGFAEVYERKFEGHNGEKETYLILWRDGVLATVESYNTTDRNSSKIYYNIRFREGIDRWAVTSSGSFEGDVWVGDHDAREGVAHTLRQLEASGELLASWVKPPFLWFATYADESDDYRAINESVINELPAEVQSAMGKVS